MDFTFYSGETYFISGTVYLSGTTTIEGGAILKFNDSGCLMVSSSDQFVFPTDVSHPAVLTSVDDSSVGEPIGTNSPVVNNACYLYINQATQSGNYVVSNLLVSYAGWAIQDTFVDGFVPLVISHCRFVHCGYAVFSESAQVALNNVLFNDCQVIASSQSSPKEILGTQVTADRCGNLLNDGDANGGSIKLTNSIISDVTNMISVAGSTFFVPAGVVLESTLIAGTNSRGFIVQSNHSYRATSSAGLYQTGGNANFYLATNSTYRNVGTNAFDSDLLAELQTMTTYAPQAGASPDTDTLDLGYHYPVNEDADNDGLADYWEWVHFGNLVQSNTDDYDSDGTSNLDEQAGGSDPNTIVFALSVTNQYTRFNSTLMQASVSSGTPFKVAMLVDSTNFASALWTNYASSNLVVNIGASEGWHIVRIGLRGRDETSIPTWRGLRVRLDTTAPILTVTSPTSTVSTPLIQLRGLFNESLSGITYTLGAITNKHAFILDRHYDTNAFDFTTNRFQAFDLNLAVGTNLVTLKAVDVAGNLTTTNLVFTLVSDTNAPTLNFVWPQPAMKLSGTNFTIRGQLDDPTAVVLASIIDTNGITNDFTGLVERDGQFWIEDLPLLSGTNIVAISVVDAWTNLLVTNLAVIKSSAMVGVAPLSGSQLWNNYVTVNGTTDETNLVIWVNGVRATVAGSDWSADGVSLGSSGTANVSVTAYPPVEEPSIGGTNAFQTYVLNPQSPNAVNIEFNRDKPSRIYIAEDYQQFDYYGGSFFSQYEIESGPSGDDGGSLSEGSNHHVQGWSSEHGGGSLDYSESFGDSWDYMGNHYPGVSSGGLQKLWLPDGRQIVHVLPDGDIGTNNYDYFSLKIGSEHCDVSDFRHWPRTSFVSQGHKLITTEQYDYYTRHADTVWKLFNGGKSIAASESLWILSATVKAILSPRAVPPYDDAFLWDNSKLISNNLVSIGDFGAQNTNGKVYADVPKGAAVDITAKTAVAPFYTRQSGGYEPQLAWLASYGKWVGDTGNVKNYVAVKDTNGYVIIQANLDTPYINDTNAAEHIKWTGGEPVPGNPFQRRVSKATSAKTRVTATLGTNTLKADVWVIWGSVAFQIEGTNPTNAPSHPAFFEDNTQDLGLRTGHSFLGDLAICGRITEICTITPRGAHNVIASGWHITRMRMSHDFDDGRAAADVFNYTTNWVGDGPGYQTAVPDAEDKLYSIDGPAISSFGNTNTSETYNNFYTYFSLDGAVCCETNNYWHWSGRWKKDQSPPITYTNLGNGLINLPTNAYYPP